MKRLIKDTILLFVTVVLLFSCVGCRYIYNTTIDDDAHFCCSLPYEVSPTKRQYEYGEEIDINLTFIVKDPDRDVLGIDGYSYAVKIKESPYYEIIGNNEVITLGAATEVQNLNADSDSYCYFASFKIKITHQSDGGQFVDMVIKCIDEDWGYNCCHMSDDEEYPFSVNNIMFIADDDGVFLIPTLFDGLNWHPKDPKRVLPISYYVYCDKGEYVYGEEITIELMFDTYIDDIKFLDDKTYCVKILDSDSYEIIGENQLLVSAHRRKSPTTLSCYWYSASFKIQINEPIDGEERIGIVIKCVDGDWLSFQCENIGEFNSGDPEFPFKIRGLSFSADSNGIEFSPREMSFHLLN